MSMETTPLLEAPEERTVVVPRRWLIVVNPPSAFRRLTVVHLCVSVCQTVFAVSLSLLYLADCWLCLANSAFATVSFCSILYIQFWIFDGKQKPIERIRSMIFLGFSLGSFAWLLGILSLVFIGNKDALLKKTLLTLHSIMIVNVGIGWFAVAVGFRVRQLQAKQSTIYSFT